jgi:hypothetical protein
LVVIGVVVLVSSSHLSAAAGESIVVETCDRRVLEGELVKWTGSEIHIRLPSGTIEKVSRENLFEVVRQSASRNPSVPSTAGAVYLVSGDVLRLRPIRVEDENLLATWEGFPTWPVVSLPLTAIRGVIFQSPDDPSQLRRWEAAIFDASPGQDVAFLRNRDRVPGTWEGLDDTFVTFSSTNAAKLDRAGVGCLVLDPDLLDKTSEKLPSGVVTLMDGSVVMVSTWEPSDDSRLSFRMTTEAMLDVDWSDVRRVQFFGPRLISLSEAPPRVEMTPFLSRVWSANRNRSVRGGTLRVGGQIEHLGWGVHSRTRLTFDVPSDAGFLRTDVGLDDEFGSRGDAEARIVQGDRILWSGRVHSGERRLSTGWLAIRPGEPVELVADFGARADVGDEVNWLNPVFLRAVP